MPFIIVSCPAPVSDPECEKRIRELFSPYGEVGGVVVAKRGNGSAPWVAAVELRSGHDEAMAALNEAELDGHRLRVRRAVPIELDSLGG